MQQEIFMRLAMKEAGKGAGYVSPNPLVGAVIVKNGAILGTGYHRKYGGPHAEIEALRACVAAQADVTDATLYVTLEPCCHYGKTPPCTDAIIKSGIRRVVVGCTDPNPLVNKKGIAALRVQGIQVETGILEAECRKQNEIFIHGQQHKTPFVLMKYAMTADGKIATRTGDSKWITTEAARTHTHNTRSRFTAIMAGIGTVIQDNPTFTSYGTGPDPSIIICDSRLRISPDSNIVKNASCRPTYIATLSRDQKKIADLQAAGITILSAREKDHQIDLAALMIQLYGIGIDSILLEGGGQLNGSALSSGIVNRLHLYLGAKLFGGIVAPSPIAGEGIDKVTQASPLTLEAVQTIDNDVFLDYVLRR